MLVIYGPTATGKTDLALDLAKKFNGELISVDSRQGYKGLDIGTGKINFDATVKRHPGHWHLDGVKINGFDLVSPPTRFSVADFLQYTTASLFRIREAKRLPIVVGGTGFYIKALLNGIDTIGIEPNQKLRSQLEKLSLSVLYQKLQKIDSKKALFLNQSDRHNPRRLIRAIEIALSKKSIQQSNYPTIQGDYLLIGLTASNDFLYKRADLWLEKRLKKGLIDEVRHLLENDVSEKWLDNLGLEYRWITRLVLSRISKEEAVERLIGDIHSFIRRQKTWFSKFSNINLFDISNPKWRSALEKTVSLWYIRHSTQAFA